MEIIQPPLPLLSAGVKTFLTNYHLDKKSIYMRDTYMEEKYVQRTLLFPLIGYIGEYRDIFYNGGKSSNAH